MKTISLAVIDALLTHPAKTFTATEIYKQVQSIMETEVNIGAIYHYVTWEWVKKGAIERITPKGQRKNAQYRLTDKGPELLQDRKVSAEKRKYKVPPAGGAGRGAKKDPAASPTLPAELTSAQIGDAVIGKILSMKKEILEIKRKAADTVLRYDADVKAFKEQLRGKDCTIRELQADIERLKKVSNIRGRTMPFSELAVISGAHR